jgi:hypothetical protein
MLLHRYRYSLLKLTVIVFATASLISRAEGRDVVATLATSDVRAELDAEPSAPRVDRLFGPLGKTWTNQSIEVLPSSVEIGGATIPVTWTNVIAANKADAHHVVFIYECTKPHLRLEWEWRAQAAFGPLEHRIAIENLSGEDIWLPLVDSLRLRWRVPETLELHNFYVEKGADAPSAQGTHFDDVTDNYSWAGTSSTYAHPAKGERREIIPAEVVFTGKPHTTGWYAGIEFSGRTRITLKRSGNNLATALGLNPDPGPFRTQIEAGGKFVTPIVFLGAFAGGPDDAGNQLRAWVRAVLGNPLTWKDPQFPLVVNNSWGSGMQVDEKLALRMISDSKELGVEMFHVDAGWFRGVGDWYSDPKKFPHGLAAIADEAHRNGLRFGIWTDWTQAGIDTEPGALNARDPKVRDWLVADVGPAWKPEEFKGQTVDLGVPAAEEYFSREVNRIVEDYHLDMLEHDGYLVAQGCSRNDHPHAPPNRSTMKVTHDSGFDFVLDANSTDVSYHAVRAYYAIYQQTRQQHPGLLFEICNDGGRMVDFGSAAHGDYFSITDAYDPLSNRRAFFDTSYLLPSAMLESYVEKWPTPRSENFLYMLRSGMMGWVTLMLDTTSWSAEQHEMARTAIALYKEKLRPLIRDARLYHISARPDGVHWDGMEYWDPVRGQGVVYAFRGADSGEASHRFVLKGLDPARRYSLQFQDHSSADTELAGNQLMTSGLIIRLAQPLSSELVFVSGAGRK